MTSKLTRLTDEELAETLRLATSGYPLPSSTEENLRHAFAELQERRKAEMNSEPYGFTDGDRRGMIYEPQYADRLNNPLPVYRHAQPAPVVPEEITSASAPEVFEIAAEAERLGLRGTYASYACGWNACRAAMLQLRG